MVSDYAQSKHGHDISDFLSGIKRGTCKQKDTMHVAQCAQPSPYRPTDAFPC